MATGGAAWGTGYPGGQQPWYSSFYSQAAGGGHVGEIEKWFYTVDADHSGFLEAAEFSRALQAAGLSYSPTTVNKIFFAFDMQKRGRLSVQEFVSCYQFLQQTRKSFLQNDADKSGKLDWRELSMALQYSGISIPPEGVNALQGRFDPMRMGGVDLEGYTNLSLFIGNLRTFFQLKGGGTNYGSYGKGGKDKKKDKKDKDKKDKEKKDKKDKKEKKDKKDKKGKEKGLAGYPVPGGYGAPPGAGGYGGGYGAPPSGGAPAGYGAPPPASGTSGGAITVTFADLVMAAPYFS